MSPPHDLVQHALGRIVERFSLSQVSGDAPAPLMTLTSPMELAGPVGEVRLWRGEPLRTMVYVGLSIAEIDLDTHSIYAFTPSDGAVPHFVLDAVCAAGAYAYRLDLLPRVDLAAHLQYVRYCYDLLTDTTLEVNAAEGLVPAALSPLQYAMASPWMLAHGATTAAFSRTAEAVDEYLDHWFTLLEDGLAPHVVHEIDTAGLADRDRRVRANMVDPAVDPVWAQLGMLVGTDDVETIRSLIRGDGPAG